MFFAFLIIHLKILTTQTAEKIVHNVLIYIISTSGQRLVPTDGNVYQPGKPMSNNVKYH